MNTIGSYVFIDTSVFQEEGFFKPSGKVSKLFNLAENGKLNILMPEITRQEWLKHYKQNAKLPCKEFKRKAELLGDTSKIRDAINIIDSIDSEALIEESLSEHIKNPELMLLDMIIAEMLRAFLRNILNKKSLLVQKEKIKSSRMHLS